MGASDVVPGVSGGTVALILGIYNGLITNIGTGSKALGRLLRGDVSGFIAGLKAVDWLFLVPLLAGIGSAVLILSGIIESALLDYPEAMAGLFFGLVIGSIVVAKNLLRLPEAQHGVIVLVVGIVTFLLLGFQSGPVSDPGPLFLIVAGALAICAMILPGISGSFILLMIGMYATVLNAVDERIISEIALVGVGAIIGLGLFSSVLNYLLDVHHDRVMAVRWNRRPRRCRDNFRNGPRATKRRSLGGAGRARHRQRNRRRPFEHLRPTHRLADQLTRPVSGLIF